METFQPHNWDAWVGTDEAGKGDYFGSLVAAGVYVNAEIRDQLHTLGVRDGKKLSDSRIRELAREIRMRWGHYATSIEVTPLQYNALYADFKRKGQNLNNLLASLHAKAIKNLHNRLDCRHILVDRFAKRADVLESQLQPLTSTIELVQVPKAEGDIAVAAASIIARETFLRRLEQLSKRFDIQLPKGATSVIDVGRKFVEQHGAEALRHVAKLHFRTTDAILPKMINGSMG